MRRTRFVPKNLKPWSCPQNYCGSEYPDYYRTGFGQSRDSGLLERCNFSAALDRLGGETPRGVIVTRASHWACGWVESILVHKSAYAKLRTADGLREYVDETYPILDEDGYYELQNEEREETVQTYSAEFVTEIETLLGRKLETQDEIAEVVDLIHDVYFDDCDYCGDENAWVRKSSVRRYLESYEGRHNAKPISVSLRKRLCVVKLN